MRLTTDDCFAFRSLGAFVCGSGFHAVAHLQARVDVYTKTQNP